MVSCGITPSEEQIKIYEALKTDKVHRCYALKLNAKRDGLEDLFIGDRDFTLENLKEKIPANDCVYVIYDFEFQTFEEPPRDTSKLLLIFWCPDTAPIRVKAPFASSKNDLKGAFSGIAKDIMASDSSILDFEELRKECC